MIKCVRLRWRALAATIQAKINPTGFATGSGGIFAADPAEPPEDLAEAHKWYGELHAKYTKCIAQLAQEEAPELNPGDAWRRGEALNVFGSQASAEFLYPDESESREPVGKKNVAEAEGRVPS